MVEWEKLHDQLALTKAYLHAETCILEAEKAHELITKRYFHTRQQKLSFAAAFAEGERPVRLCAVCTPAPNDLASYDPDSTAHQHDGIVGRLVLPSRLWARGIPLRFINV